ncbi:carboxyl transferase domain protein, partial [Chlamydia psittaci 03DC29]
CSP